MSKHTMVYVSMSVQGRVEPLQNLGRLKHPTPLTLVDQTGALAVFLGFA
jgi:hypothetical protein